MVDEQMGMKEEGFPNPSRPEKNAAFLPMFRKQGHPAAVLVKALVQLQTHVLCTSGMPQELMAPTFDLALEQLASLRVRFLAPYDRRTWHLFLCVLAFACLAVPIEQTALDRLRDCLTVVERQCSALVEGIGYSIQRADVQSEEEKEYI